MELQDDIISPFPTSTRKNYIAIQDQILPDIKYSDYGFNFRIFIELGNKIHIEKRIRYSIWNLVSDVGGFSDGITLVCNIFMTAYSAMAFKTSFLNRSYYDLDKDPREH